MGIFNLFKKHESLTNSDCKYVEKILKLLEDEIKQAQGWAPDQWWLIVKDRAEQMYIESDGINSVTDKWSMQHAIEYENRADWKSFEDKTTEIQFRIERYSEILYSVIKACNKVSDIMGSYYENRIIDAHFYITKKEPQISLAELLWWRYSAEASLFGCFIFAKKIGISNDDIKITLKNDFLYEKYKIKLKAIAVAFKQHKYDEKFKEDVKEVYDQVDELNDDEEFLKPHNTFHENGNKKLTGYLNASGKIHGNIKLWYASGKIKQDANFKNGIKHGYVKEYFENGKIKLDFNFVNGVEDGNYKEFYENGEKNIVGNFKNGKEHGLREQFYSSGNIETRNNFKNGIMEGVQIYLDEDGEVIEEKIMQNGYDITLQLMSLMIANKAEHMVSAGLIKNGVSQELKNGELSEKIYNYYKKNNLYVESPGEDFNDKLQNILENQDVNWSKEELISLYAINVHMGMADGNYEHNERISIIKNLLSLPGAEKIEDWKLVHKKGEELKPTQIFSTLKKLNISKRKLAIDILRQTAEADGVFSHEEKKLWEILKNILKD